MTPDQIKAVFLANGFKEKDQGDGRMDLSPYVYKAARALLAEQAQGEPVAWLLCNGDEQPIDSTIRWDVAKHWPEYAAPLFTHADPGEVERLREENRVLQKQLGERWSDIRVLEASVEGQSFQLAKRNALPHEMYVDEQRRQPNSWNDYAMGWNACLKQASAEPSAPVCDRCQGKGLYTLNGLCPKCGVSEFVAYKPSAPVEREGMTCMVDAAMAEMSNIHPPLKRSDCERLIRAALVGKA